MRKVRDYDAELKALEDKTRAPKARRVEQLGQLVSSAGADTLDMEILAGVHAPCRGFYKYRGEGGVPRKKPRLLSAAPA